MIKIKHAKDVKFSITSAENKIIMQILDRVQAVVRWRIIISRTCNKMIMEHFYNKSAR